MKIKLRDSDSEPYCHVIFVQACLKEKVPGNIENTVEMNRLAVGRSARAQQAHKVNNRINWLMSLLKTDTDTQTTAMSGDLSHNRGQTMNRILARSP